MATPEMEKTIAKLRFLLADIEAKEGELAALIRQFKRQMQQAVTYATRRELTRRIPGRHERGPGATE